MEEKKEIDMDWTKRIEKHGWICIGLDAGGAALEYALPVFIHPKKKGWIKGDGPGWAWVHQHKTDFIGKCDIPASQ